MRFARKVLKDSHGKVPYKVLIVSGKAVKGLFTQLSDGPRALQHFTHHHGLGDLTITPRILQYP